MRSLTLLALISLAAAIPIPQSDSGFDNGVLVGTPNNQGTTPSQPAINNPSGGGNDGGFSNGQPVNDVSNNSPVTNTPLAPVDSENGGNDGGYVDGAPVDPNAPASGSIRIAKKAVASGVTVSAENILAISPDASSCATAQFPNECRTAQQAAPLVSASFSKFGITNKNEAAAILSLMMFESGNFQFNTHHFPGPNPGQGTRNMMNFPFILKYAQDVLPDSDKASLPASADVDGTTKDTVLGKVLGDDFSFGSGAWFYSKMCTPEIKAGVQSGSDDGWRRYITDCVGGTLDKREDSWNKAKLALA